MTAGSKGPWERWRVVIGAVLLMLLGMFLVRGDWSGERVEDELVAAETGSGREFSRINESQDVESRGRVERSLVSRGNRAGLSVEHEKFQPKTYLEALIDMVEKEGKDNALLHYALAIELSPEAPTAQQRELINRVLDEGWVEEANDLLPYLMKWEPAFEEVMAGAALDYMKGPISEDPDTMAALDILRLQDLSRMVSLYGRYLEYIGRKNEAGRILESTIRMGRAFGEEGNLLTVALTGSGIQRLTLRQINQIAAAGKFAGRERELIISMGEADRSRPYVAILEAELNSTLAGLMKGLTDREYYAYLERQNPGMYTREHLTDMVADEKRLYALVKEYFHEPYYARSDLEVDPETYLGRRMLAYQETELRMLEVQSRLRQQQIDLAAQAYMNNEKRPAPDINALVEANYLPGGVMDPFTGEAFIYKVIGNDYELYGGGPNRSSPWNEKVAWTSGGKGNYDGVVRIR